MLNADTERKVSDLSVEELKNLVSEIVEDSIEKCEVTGTMEGRSKLNLKVEGTVTVSYTHLRAHETSLHLVCRLLLETKKLARR